MPGKRALSGGGKAYVGFWFHCSPNPIRAYLRASTEDQFADRAKEMLEQFVQERGHKIASYYRENISGTKLDRPELGRLLMDSHHNDILLVEQ
ncbi:recombinase family protein, partial [Pseudomonas aeruginosa]